MDIPKTNIKGLIVFRQTKDLSDLQKRMAEGVSNTLTIDWGDYQRHNWNILAVSIVQIKAQKALMRTNRCPSIIKDISHIVFPHLKVINLNDNRIKSIEFVPKLQMPSLKQLDLSHNYIVSTRSLVKSYLPELEKINLADNLVFDLQNIFKSFFPKLSDITIDQNDKVTWVKNVGSWSDPIIWRIKHAPVLVKESQGPSRRRLVYYGTIEKNGQKLSLKKYQEMLNHKPRYFSQHFQ